LIASYSVENYAKLLIFLMSGLQVMVSTTKSHHMAAFLLWITEQ